MHKNNFWKGFISGLITFILMAYIGVNKMVKQADISLQQLEVQDLKGQKTEWSNYTGKPLVINYWATWCAGCIKEFPHFKEVQEQMGNSINFIMISDESIEKISKFKESKSYSFNYLKAINSLGNYGIHILPTTYFYNASGNLVKKYTGTLTSKRLKQLIAEIK